MNYVYIQYSGCRDTIKDHDKRLVALEIENGFKGEIISALCDKIEELTDWIKRMIKVFLNILLTCLAATSGFIIWFIQGGH